MKTQETAQGAQQVSEWITEAIDCLDKMHSNSSDMALLTGHAKLDEMIGGLRPGEQALFVARPGIGLTSWALGMARRIVTGRTPQRVGFISLETGSAAQLVLRLICSRAGVSLREVRSGKLSAIWWEKLMLAAQEIKNAPLYLETTGSLEMSTLREKVEALHRAHDIRVLFVDNIQRVQISPSERGGVISDLPARVSAGLQAMAEELHISVVALAKLPPSADPSITPLNAEQLNELCTWGRHADMTAVLHRKDTLWQSYGSDKKEQKTELMVIGNGFGPAGTVTLDFFPDEIIRDANVAADSDGDDERDYV